MGAVASDVTRLGAGEIAGLIARGELSATDAVKAHVERIQALNPKLNAVVVPLFDQALAAARKADARGAARGPLHGVPVTVKECFDVAGTATTAGVSALAAGRAASDAVLVTRLRKAGAIVLGKTNVAQLLLYVESDNPVYGRANNPWNLDRSPGGSSGGEGASVAAGFSALGLGTDIGGSIRIPGHFCGIQALRPTPGRLSLDGAIDQRIFLGNDSVPDAAGPLARSVADLELALHVLGRSEPGDHARPPVALRDPGAVQVKGLRVGFYADDGVFPASAAIRRAVKEAAAALAAAGARVSEFRPPEVADAILLFYQLLTADAGEGVKRLLGGSSRDPRVADLLLFAGLPRAARLLLAPVLRAQGKLRAAEALPLVGPRSARAFLDLVDRRHQYRRRFDAAAREFDVLVCPPCSLPAVTHGAAQDLGAASVNYTALYNLLAWPAGVVAATRVRPDEEGGRAGGPDVADKVAQKVDAGSAGLPVGVQVAARPWRDDLVLAVMAALEGHFKAAPDYPAAPPT